MHRNNYKNKINDKIFSCSAEMLCDNLGSYLRKRTKLTGTVKMQTKQGNPKN